MTLNAQEMFAVKMSSAGTLRVHGTATPLPLNVVLSTGWSWLPCPYQTSEPLATGAPTFSYAQSDQYRSQAAFSEYYE